MSGGRDWSRAVKVGVGFTGDGCGWGGGYGSFLTAIRATVVRRIIVVGVGKDASAEEESKGEDTQDG